MTGSGRVMLPHANGRILAEDIFSDINMPPFDKSAVDGFACRKDDLGGDLAVRETIAAGAEPQLPIMPGTCSKIMTGAMVPPGADCIFMVEDSAEVVPGTVRFTGTGAPVNICYMGEDIKAGEKVLSGGILIRPQEIAVLATAGVTRPLVAIQPRVAVITTGDELVHPSVKPSGALIRNSNSYQLEAQIARAGGIPTNMGIVEDKRRSILEVLLKAIPQHDIILLTGGVSMGDFDYVPDILKSAGISILFRKIAIQPGKPTLFGKYEDKIVFGLPGNPVSSFVLFEMLVRPLILKMMGWQGTLPVFRLPLGTDFTRRKTERKALIPVAIRNGEVFPVDYHGSAHINAYAGATGIIMMEIGVNEMKKGTLTDVRPV